MKRCAGEFTLGINAFSIFMELALSLSLSLFLSLSLSLYFVYNMF